ncbi:hypothetical protein EWP20_02570 [Neisseria meningitidis]|nr:hypothetical protein [Neisseria meningitidis]MBG8609053.1 hypothetical protein [Neisseria meningitidis]MBG8628837.1 hypothetical protein [Neisseria meningitidis]MBG8641878.1 hypothetical protein [Neisseria meningitidis]MBG8650806.1 hypothetical protein [Neisseria meningitidis]
MSKCRLKPPNSISDGIFCTAICLYNGGGVSRLRCCRNATEPSFPRKWESRISRFQSFPIDSRLRGNDGFQDYGVVGMQLNRHSHGSGNL